MDDKFVRFPCNCGEQLTLEKAIMPGDVAVMECDNCKLSWTVYNPFLVIKKTKELTGDMQKVWELLAHG